MFVGFASEVFLMGILEIYASFIGPSVCLDWMVRCPVLFAVEIAEKTAVGSICFCNRCLIEVLVTL